MKHYRFPSFDKYFPNKLFTVREDWWYMVEGVDNRFEECDQETIEPYLKNRKLINISFKTYLNKLK